MACSRECRTRERDLIPAAHITAWRKSHPWADDAQVEQDLVISRALVELYSAPGLQEKLLFRGGTALHKIYLPPSSRYSEDIDLVQLEPGPIGPLFDEIRKATEPFLGSPSRKQGPNVVNLVFRFQSEIPPVRTLRLKIEINTRDHFHVYPPAVHILRVESPWFSGSCNIRTYSLEELLGTKMRALYQRNKGRDLFDLWLGLQKGTVNAERVVKAFDRYLAAEGLSVSKKEYQENVLKKIKNPRFLSDIRPLLRAGVDYNVQEAVQLLLDRLVSRLA